MIYRMLSLGAVVTAGLTLSACTLTTSTTVNQNRWMKQEVSAEKLSNGKQLMIGYRTPSKSNQCHLVGKESKNWANVKFKGQFKPHLGNAGYGALRDIAVAYANKHTSVNYAYLYIPNTSSVMGFNLGLDKQAVLRYYSCKKPPVKHSNL